MALTPLADDSAIFEYSYTTGNTGVYHLAGSWGGFFTFKSEWPAGAPSIPIRVTDGSANTEISNAIYNAGANTLTVIGAPLASTNGGALVNWSGRTRMMIHALVKVSGGSITLCPTMPWDGADLAWNGTNNNWCPDSRIFGKPGGLTGGGFTAGPPSLSSDVSLKGADESGGGQAGAIFGAAGNAVSGAGGSINLIAGTGNTSVTGPNGNIYLQSGGRGNAAFITLSGQYSAIQSGDIVVFAGDAVAGSNVPGGGLFVMGGKGNGIGAGGPIEAFSGLPPNATGTSGPVNIGSAGGTTNQNTGHVSFGTGDISGGGTGIAGDTTIYGGLSAAGGGNIRLQTNTGTLGTPGSGGAILIGIANPTPGFGSSPPTPPVGVYALYVELGTGNLVVKGSSGTITTIAVP